MNKVIIGTFQEISAMAEMAVEYADDQELSEQFALSVAELVHKLQDEVNKARTVKDPIVGWFTETADRAKFNIGMTHPMYRVKGF